MRRRLRYLWFLLLVLPAAVVQADAALRVMVLGDLPYRSGERPALEALFAAGVAGGSPFLVHLGDIKSGTQPCTDALLADRAALFRAQPLALVYTPGDNEWTDCHRLSAGRFDPLERLARLRELFFADPEVLRLAALEVAVSDPAYPEIHTFTTQGVRFVALHVVGSDNGARVRASRAQAAFTARDALNTTLMLDAAAHAEQEEARALVLMLHADPLFEKSRPTRGFAAFHAALNGVLARYSGPVLVLHGDSHLFRHDQPFAASDAEHAARLTRIEVPGSPLIGAVWVSIDPESPKPFAAELVSPSHFLDQGN